MIRRGIVAAGNFIVDRVAIVDRWPEQDTLATIESMETANGGLAFNVLVDLARLRVPYPLAAIGVVGDDEDGRFVRSRCRKLRIADTGLRTSRRVRTAFSNIVSVRDTGRRTIFFHPGANRLLDERDFDFAKMRARVLLLGFLALLERLDRPLRRFGTAAAKVLARARDAGIVTAADVVSDLPRLPTVVPPTLPHLDWLFMNELEAQALTSVRVRRRSGAIDRGAFARVVRNLGGRGFKGHAVIHTAEGAACAGAEGVVWQGSVRVPRTRIAGTNGAGDAFAAGFLHGVHEGWSAEVALRAGVCVAAASLQRGTPSDGIVLLGRCLALGARFGFRA